MYVLRSSAVGTAILITALAGCGVLDNRASYGEDQVHGQTLPEGIACSRMIVVGDVVRVTSEDSPRVSVTMRVSQWIRPSHGRSTLTFSDRNPKIDGSWAPWKVGGPVLVVIPLKTSEPAHTFRGKELTFNKRYLMSGLKEASHTVCPSPWAPSSP